MTTIYIYTLVYIELIGCDAAFLALLWREIREKKEALVKKGEVVAIYAAIICIVRVFLGDMW